MSIFLVLESYHDYFYYALCGYQTLFQNSPDMAFGIQLLLMLNPYRGDIDQSKLHLSHLQRKVSIAFRLFLVSLASEKGGNNVKRSKNDLNWLSPHRVDCDTHQTVNDSLSTQTGKYLSFRPSIPTQSCCKTVKRYTM